MQTGFLSLHFLNLILTICIFLVISRGIENKKETAKKQLIFKQVDRGFEDAIRYIENSKN